MQGAEWVLVSKSDDSLYVKLTTKKAGRSKGIGRAVWELTEDFREASYFESHDEIATGLKKHRCPLQLFKLKQYTRAHQEYWQRRTDPDGNLTLIL